MSVVGKDGNNQMFPIAYAVLDSENYSSWKWFVDLLIADLNGIQEGCGFESVVSFYSQCNKRF